MPLINPSTFHPPLFLKNRHVQTIYPAIARRVPDLSYHRERLELPDGDFIDLDWVKAPARRLVVLLHGLEGNTHRSYMKGMAKIFNTNGWSVLAMNFRGCSGEANRLLRSYHAGATDDLRHVLRHASSTGQYDCIGLVGFSLGGNLLLKYLGEEGGALSPSICGAVAFSVPCDLAASVEAMSKPANRVYMKNFLKQLGKKLETKQQRFPEAINLLGYDHLTTFVEFDDRYTAPIHGFENAAEYWRLNSCQVFLPRIQAPTLIVNALDDPFLSESCFPRKAALNSSSLFLETPKRGGHVGFMQLRRTQSYWSELRAIEFLERISDAESLSRRANNLSSAR